MDMIEQVANAMLAALRASDEDAFLGHRVAAPGEGTTIDGHFDLHAVARAVIKAMLEPTEAMLKAGMEALPVEDGIEPRPSEADMVWNAMLSAALGTSTQKQENTK